VLASGVALTGVLGDVVFLSITIAFFAVAWLLIRACERIAGGVELPVDRLESGAPEVSKERELVGGRA
jgi:hypothetical protein